MELTDKHIRDAIKRLELRTEEYGEPLFWVDNENWYQGDEAKIMGFTCNKEELEMAKMNDKGFIKNSQGVDLYLSKPLPCSF